MIEVIRLLIADVSCEGSLRTSDQSKGERIIRLWDIQQKGHPAEVIPLLGKLKSHSKYNNMNRSRKAQWLFTAYCGWK